jgi:thiol:disulfide interchange protein
MLDYTLGRTTLSRKISSIGGNQLMIGVETTDRRNGHPCRLLQFALAASLISAPAAAFAQEHPVTWKLSPPRTSRGEVMAKLDAAIEDGWYLYSQTEPPGGPIPTSIGVIGAGFTLTAVPRAPDPERRPDRNFNIISEVYTDSVRFVLPLSRTGASRDSLRVAVRYQTCTTRYCLPPRTDTVVAFATAQRASVLQESPRIPPPAPPSRLETSLPKVPAVRGAFPQVARPELSAFLGFACLTALLALLTPCVFPMIPITVGFFTRRGENARHTAPRDASLFAAGIIGSFAALGFAVSAIFGAGNIVRFAANPWLNLVVAALFLLFALQLAGWISVPMPSALATRLTIATTGRRDAGAIVLMGVVFSLTSFTCTAPFVGSLLVLASRGDWAWPLLGLLTYATVFALPFFALALFPRALSRLPRSGPWLVSLKGVVAFLELAAVVKFVSNADLVWGWGILTRDVVLMAWLAIAMSLAAWLTIAAVRRGTAEPGALRAGRLVVAAASLVAAVRIAGGLSGAALGEVESYLPPPRANVLLAYDGGHELAWRLNDFDGALAVARRTGRPILVDFTGYTCTNCRWMEANMFTRPAVRAALGRYERARLYTDGSGDRYTAQQAMEQRIFGTVALPLYAVFGPDGEPREVTFVGMSRDEAKFLDFLRTEGNGAERVAFVPKPGF